MHAAKYRLNKHLTIKFREDKSLSNQALLPVLYLACWQEYCYCAKDGFIRLKNIHILNSFNRQFVKRGFKSLLFFRKADTILTNKAALSIENCLKLQGYQKSPMTEEAILKGCLQNNAVAQKELYNRYSPKMLAVCYRFAHNREDAEDMLQEGFIKVFSQIHTFRNQGAFEGWVRRIIVHTCINNLKKNKKFNESVDLIHATAMQVREESVPSIVQAKQVVECIRILPIGYRTVLNLYAIEGYSHREIGDMLDIEESTSRSQYTRAKQMLEDILIKKKILQQPIKKMDPVTAFGR
jgi:RNA polymerase sigma factor (sigma-70 family)